MSASVIFGYLSDVLFAVVRCLGVSKRGYSLGVGAPAFSVVKFYHCRLGQMSNVTRAGNKYLMYSIQYSTVCSIVQYRQSTLSDHDSYKKKRRRFVSIIILTNNICRFCIDHEKFLGQIDFILLPAPMFPLEGNEIREPNRFYYNILSGYNYKATYFASNPLCTAQLKRDK